MHGTSTLDQESFAGLIDSSVPFRLPMDLNIWRGLNSRRVVAGYNGSISNLVSVNFGTDKEPVGDEMKRLLQSQLVYEIM